jgi:hypothetical protein
VLFSKRNTGLKLQLKDAVGNPVVVEVETVLLGSLKLARQGAGVGRRPLDLLKFRRFVDAVKCGPAMKHVLADCPANGSGSRSSLDFSGAHGSLERRNAFLIPLSQASDVTAFVAFAAQPGVLFDPNFVGVLGRVGESATVGLGQRPIELRCLAVGTDHLLDPRRGVGAIE